MLKCKKCGNEFNEFELIDGACGVCYDKENPVEVLYEVETEKFDTKTVNDIVTDSQDNNSEVSTEPLKISDYESITPTIAEDKDTFLDKYGKILFFSAPVLLLAALYFTPKYLRYKVHKDFIDKWHRIGEIVINTDDRLMWEDDTHVKTEVYWPPKNGRDSYCNNLRLGGYSDWRLPTKAELRSIIFSPTEIASAFKNIESGVYATSEREPYLAIYNDFLINFSSGSMGEVEQSNIYQKVAAYIRCVRQATRTEIKILPARLKKIEKKKAKLKQKIMQQVKKCKNGNYSECHKLGLTYSNKKSSNKDYVKAAEFYKVACDHSIKESCTNLGVLYASGKGGKQDVFKAVKLFKQACLSGDAIGCSNLASEYLAHNSGVKFNTFSATVLYKKACNLGYQKACDYYRETKRRYNVSDIPSEALNEYNSLKQKGKHTAMAIAIDDFGKYSYGTAWNYSTQKEAIESAMKWCRKNKKINAECNPYSIDGKVVFGKNIEETGVLNSYKESNNAIKLGIQYDRGDGIEHNLSQAILLYQKACGLGNSHGCILYKKAKKRSDKFINLQSKGRHTAMAVAIDNEGNSIYGISWKYSTPKKAIKSALNSCRKNNKLKAKCKLYSIDGQIVYGKQTNKVYFLNEDKIETKKENKVLSTSLVPNIDSTIVNINFKSKNIKKNEISKENKVGKITYRLKTINGKFCDVEKACLDVTLKYPIDVKSNYTTLTKAINNITKQMIPGFDPDSKQDYLKIMGLSYWDKAGSLYDFYISLKPIAVTDTTFSIEKCSGGYTGGAHGFGGCEYFNYAIKTNKKIKLNDLLRPNTEYQLMRAIEKQFRKVNHLSPYQSMTKVGLFENKLEKPDGFYITKTGLHFYYSAGTIAPMAATGAYEGSFEVPYSMIATLLKPDGVLGAKSKKVDNGRQSLTSFLQSYVSAGNTQYPPDTVVQFFAPFVHPYFNIRNATHRDILKDKKAYYRKWPNRNYRLTRYYILRRYQLAGLNYLEVRLDIDWRVSSPQRGVRTGHSVVTMTLAEERNSYKITAIQNTHIARNIVPPQKTMKLIPPGSFRVE